MKSIKLINKILAALAVGSLLVQISCNPNTPSNPTKPVANPPTEDSGQNHN